MTRFRREKRLLTRGKALADSKQLVLSTTIDVPRINLSQVETCLDMHQYNGLFEASPSERQNGSVVEPSSSKFFLLLPGQYTLQMRLIASLP
jgi:hypothetical protein